MPPEGYPICEFIKAPDTNTFIGKTGYDMEVKCKMCKSEVGCTNVQVKDLSNIKITPENALGTISNIRHNGDAEGKSSELIIKFKYKPNNNVSGIEKLTFGEGVVKNPNLPSKVNKALPELVMKVDAVDPKLVIAASGTVGTAVDGGSGFENKMEVTITCEDQGTLQSGISTFKVNNASKLAPTFKNTKSKRGTFTYSAICTDKATPGNTKSDSKTYRIIKNEENPRCGIEKYKSCKTSDCGCKKRKRNCKKCGCESYKTTYSTLCRWCCSGSDGTECSKWETNLS